MQKSCSCRVLSYFFRNSVGFFINKKKALSCLLVFVSIPKSDAIESRRLENADAASDRISQLLAFALQLTRCLFFKFGPFFWFHFFYFLICSFFSVKVVADAQLGTTKTQQTSKQKGVIHWF